jgi:hypothetical protein
MIFGDCRKRKLCFGFLRSKSTAIDHSRQDLADERSRRGRHRFSGRGPAEPARRPRRPAALVAGLPRWQEICRGLQPSGRVHDRGPVVPGGKKGGEKVEALRPVVFVSFHGVGDVQAEVAKLLAQRLPCDA